ncbi:DUF5659 domain-containing protein [Caloramator australicus]|uniref:DUF5659 domain-containing protein n=1 Tax=Caloramator australicus RC3 TaxID=857293 RepID=I7LIL1_9CLOT|nr:DUF5659 domain-containing protein [Caloramator australicus]CCJ33052.1 hypothetical protein CAAU_0968 [Caloramator australicus RC3]
MKEYKTISLNRAAVLLSCGIKLLRIEDSKKGKQFVFEYSPKVDELINDFLNGSLNCNIKVFIDNIRQLKDILLS